MAKKARNKLKQEEIDKIHARYELKFEEFKQRSLDDLKIMFNIEKMSSTDKHALVMATQHLLQQQIKDEVKG